MIFTRLVPPADLDKTINEITTAIDEDRKNKGVSLRGPVFGLQGIVWIGIILSVFQQFVGINVIFYYSTSLWNSVGFTELRVHQRRDQHRERARDPDRDLPRRPRRADGRSCSSGSVVMALSLGTMALAFTFSTVNDKGEVTLGAPWGPIALVAANLFVIGFGASWGPLVWVLLGEIFPSRIRGKALGVAAGAQWIANFLITVSFPAMSSWSLPLTYAHVRRLRRTVVLLHPLEGARDQGHGPRADRDAVPQAGQDRAEASG